MQVGRSLVLSSINVLLSLNTLEEPADGYRRRDD
jgi:hypothetical protein